MHESGLTGPTWNIVRKLNQNLKAQIKTKDGLTREIRIKDSIRQGGVLSVIEYADVMDKIAKEIKNQNLGIKIDNNENKVGCLLWMDDVLLMADTPKELQKLLDTTERIAKKYHIEFGEPKSKIMVLGKNPNKNTGWKIGEQQMAITEDYKYLGEIINRKRSMKKQLSETRRKVEGALQTILTVAGDPNLLGIQMETIWKLVETCIQPIASYGSELWDLNKEEIAIANRTLNSILKRILMVPTSTPAEALYMETGIEDLTSTMNNKRIGMYYRLNNTGSDLIRRFLNSEEPTSWKKKTETIIDKLQIDPNKTMTNQGKQLQRRKTKTQITDDQVKRITETAETKSKVRHLILGIRDREDGKRPPYMNRLNRKQVSSIFKARTRMLDVKNNYRGKHNDLRCRGYRTNDETQEHILNECMGIHDHQTTKVTNENIFDENTENLKGVAMRIEKIMKKLLQSEANNQIATR